jgi:hypothetical protein
MSMYKFTVVMRDGHEITADKLERYEYMLNCIKYQRRRDGSFKQDPEAILVDEAQGYDRFIDDETEIPFSNLSHIIDRRKHGERVKTNVVPISIAKKGEAK